MWNWDRHHSRMRGGLIAALDVGSSKVCCVIAQVQGRDNFEILGIGQQLSSGVKSGVVIDMEEVITSIVNAVHTAEKMAGVTIRDVIVSINGTHFKSVNLGVEMNVSGHPINDTDVRRVLLQAKASQEDSSFQALHTVPTSYALDGAKGIKDPRGMYGERLLVSLYTLFSKASPLYNLSTCVARSHLEVANLVAAPYASGLACLVEDEMELGVILIDMGGSTTSFAVFHEGQLRHAECIPIGGAHVTMDIARGFSTTMTNAERLKTLYGSAMHSAADDREMMVIPLVGEKRGEGVNQMPRSALVSVIKPRIEETFEYVRKRLMRAGVDSLTGQRVVLTGGASQLAGAREVASLVLGKSIRLGKPIHLGASELSQDPSFSTCTGLLSYGQAEHLAYLQALPQTKSRQVIAQIGSFLRQIW
ncbi:MAG TPA: cell division protein FtsA [Alphaproteobacteria bacterium]|nr:cell division protein FtsA [Alphaproteobacteria bacterium]